MNSKKIVNNCLVVNTSNPTSPAENGTDSNENSSSALDQAMAATLAAIEVPESQDKSGIDYYYEISIY